jgi:hypothetical protein
MKSILFKVLFFVPLLSTFMACKEHGNSVPSLEVPVVIDVKELTEVNMPAKGYHHYVLFVQCNSSDVNRNYFDFDFESALTLQCGMEQQSPALYINEGKVPGNDKMNRVLVAFENNDTAGCHEKLLVVNSNQVGRHEIKL